MKLRSVAVASLGGFAFACSSSSSVDTGPYVPDSGMTIAASCSDDMPCHLTPGMKQSSYIYPVGHSDPWLFDVPSAGQIIHLVVSNDADFSPVHLQVSLFRQTATSTIPWTGVRTDTYHGNGKQKIDMQVVAVTAGSYKAVVSAVNGDGADRRNPYYIQLDLTTDTDPNEPNNDKDHATPLMPGMPNHGTIGYQGNQDWFSIMAPARKLLHVKLTAPAPAPAGSGLRFRYELFGPDGTSRIAENDEPAYALCSADSQCGTYGQACVNASATACTGGTCSCTVVLEENRAVVDLAGKWYIRITDVDGTHADLVRLYEITANFLDDPDTHEPNNTPTTPTVVTAGQTLTGYIASRADVDYYALNIPNAGPNSPQLITASTHMPNSRVTLELEVLKPDGMTPVCDGEEECKAIRFSQDGTRCGGDLATSHVVRVPGVYLIAVRDHGDQNYDTMVPYTVTIDNPPEPDQYERYEKKKEDGRVIPAITSTLGTSITYAWVDGYISYAGDVDWFIFDIPGDMGAPPGQNGDWLVKFEIQKPGPTPLEFQMFFQASDLEYGGYGHSCHMPMQGACDPTGCYSPPDQNAIPCPSCAPPVPSNYGEAYGDCIVVFREHTRVGPHYIRISDLNHDHFDTRPGIGGYRFQMTITAKCPPSSVCAGKYTDAMGGDLCHRP